MVLAGALGLCALVLPSDPVVAADVRLDDHETSWPDHADVQADAVDALNEALKPFDGTVRARQDRSTVKVAGFDGRDRDVIDTAIGGLVERDRQARRNSSDTESLRDRLQQFESAQQAAERSAVSEELILEMTDELNELRSALADSEIAARSGRSRFVALGYASSLQYPAQPEQSVLAIGLLLAGIATLLKSLRAS